MNRKASSIILMIFEILVVVTVIWLALKVAVSYAQSETVVRINTANDLSMMINALVATPGEAIIEYPHNVSQFSFSLSKDRLIVTNKEEEDKFESSKRPLYLPKGYQASGEVQEEAKICLKKKNLEKKKKTIFLQEF